jgi:glycosyltransferase involved in cell wall biosynthesis
LEQVVTFAGATSHEQKIDFLNQMWLAVNPSPKEGWGLTVIEANCCGIPVIAADSPGLRDSVVASKTGLLYPYGNYHELAEQIIELIKNDSLRESLAKECIDWAHQFNWEQSAANMLNLIEKVLSRR